MLNWQFTETRDSEIAKFRVGGLTAIVQDCDGDASLWEVREGKRCLAKGEENGYEPYHFVGARIAAEKALRSIVAQRKEAILSASRLRDTKGGEP